MIEVEPIDTKTKSYTIGQRFFQFSPTALVDEKDLALLDGIARPVKKIKKEKGGES